jgi:hypothetical protein
LRTGEPRCSQKLFRLLAEGVGGLQERYKDAVLQGDSRVGEFGARIHYLRIVVVTMIVKRKYVRL